MRRREANREIENLIIDDVEFDKGIVPGDFRRAVGTMWMTLSHLMRCDELYDIRVSKWGRYYPSWKEVNKTLRRELKYKLRDRSKLEALFKKRRWIIENGGATETYYLRKLMCNGRTEDERRSARTSLEVLQQRVRGLGKTGQQAAK